MAEICGGSLCVMLTAGVILGITVALFRYGVAQDEQRRRERERERERDASKSRAG